VGLKPILRTTTSFSALTLLIGSFDPQKLVPGMTYNVFSGTLNPAQSRVVLNQFCLLHPFITDLLNVDGESLSPAVCTYDVLLSHVTLTVATYRWFCHLTAKLIRNVGHVKDRIYRGVNARVHQIDFGAIFRQEAQHIKIGILFHAGALILFKILVLYKSFTYLLTYLLAMYQVAK